MKRAPYLVVQIGHLNLNIPERGSEGWAVRRHGGSWVVFAGRLFSLGYWKFDRALRMGVRR